MCFSGNQSLISNTSLEFQSLNNPIESCDPTCAWFSGIKVFSPPKDEEAHVPCGRSFMKFQIWYLHQKSSEIILHVSLAMWGYCPSRFPPGWFFSSKNPNLNDFQVKIELLGARFLPRPGSLRVCLFQKILWYQRVENGCIWTKKVKVKYVHLENGSLFSQCERTSSPYLGRRSRWI